MPTDLDELFEALGRQADTVPLAGAEQARQRGRRRTRVRAAVCAAAAVVLVVAGFGLALRPPERRADRPVPADRAPAPPVGSPIDLGGKIAHSVSSRDDRRVYTAFVRYQDNSAGLIAADLRSGAVAWAARPIDDPRRSITQVVVVPRAVLVVTAALNGVTAAAGLFAFDPATGAPLWQKENDDAQQLVYSDRMLIQVTPGRQAVGFDWATGRQRWSEPLGGDGAGGGSEPVRALGLTTPADEERVNQAGPPPDFTDSRFVLVTAAGVAQLRDVDTGRLRRSVPVTPASLSGATMVAYGGWLFSHDEQDDAPGELHIRATDLTGDGGSRVIGVLPGRLRTLRTLGGCGPDRVCVVTQAESGDKQTVVTAIDARTARRVWQTPAQGGDQLSSAHGRTMLTAAEGGYQLFDAAGHSIFDSVLTGGWLDAGTLLVAAPDGTARLSRWPVTTKRLHPLQAPLPMTIGNCTSTADRLACVTPAGLQLWKVG